MKRGFLQALGVSLYITLVSLFMWNANRIFGRLDGFFGPAVVLLLFSTSVLLCGLMVFYYPYKLFFAGKKKEALDVVIFTAAWLFTFFIFFLIGLLIFN